MDDICQNINLCNPNKKNKILITFQDMMADKLGNRNLRPIKTELFIRCRKLNNYLVLITQSYFPVPQKY